MQLLIEGPAHGLHGGTIGLAVNRNRVQGLAAVIGHIAVHDGDLAGFRVHFHFHGLRCIGVSRSNIAVQLVVVHGGLGVPGAGDLDAAAAMTPDGLACQFGQGGALLGVGSHVNSAAFNSQRLTRHAPARGGQGKQFVACLACCHDGRIAARHGDAGRQRAHGHG